MKRRSLFLPAIVCLLLIAFTATASAKDTWTSVRSQNFFLVGNASEKEIRQVATRLEQFRDVFTRLFNKIKFTSPVPTTVVVFKSESAYRPFNPSNAAGYFQPGQDVNYITLTTERRNSEDDPFHTIFHEYVHLLINNTLSVKPLWFNEGLAEYYSTFYLDDERKAFLGKLIGNHLLYLRQEKMLPLRTLLNVDHSSPHYNEGNKRGIFYAQSWALLHYLIQGHNGQRLPQLGTFLDLLAAGTTVEEAFKKAFQMDFPMFEKELKEYVQGGNYKMTRVTFERKLEFDTEMQSAPITEAEALAYLGDLSLHLGDLDGAEKRLGQALKLDPDLAMANSSMGMALVRRGKFAEAKPLLQRAVANNSQNYLVHFNYALALSREGMGFGNVVSGYTSEAAREMRAELKKAIELAPTFPEAYSLLSFINLVRGEELDESIALLKRGVALSPGRGQFSFMLAQLYMRKEDFKSARQVLEPLARSQSEDQQLRANAQSLLDSIARTEEQIARFKEMQREASEGRSGGASMSPRLKRRGEAAGAPSEQKEEAPEEPLTGTNYELPIRKVVAGEEQVLGLLLRIDCDAKGTTFIVKVGELLLKLRTTDFNGIQFTTYTPDVSGDITCGARNPANTVVVTYRPSKEARAKFNGDLVAVEFVPKDFELKK
ncbi:MAG TPA: tetratricopeptide repeat protein [Pyrinomonadaceae bacterium]